MRLLRAAGETTVEFCDQTLDIFAQATAIKKLIAEMKQHLASRGESAVCATRRVIATLCLRF